MEILCILSCVQNYGSTKKIINNKNMMEKTSQNTKKSIVSILYKSIVTRNGIVTYKYYCANIIL